MNPRHSGVIIRLIDVVLILLFGFISISQVEKRSRIHLPVSSETEYSKPAQENLIRVAVTPVPGGGWGFLVENESKFVPDVLQLQRYLFQQKQFYKAELRVKIYSESSSPMKYTMQVADLCEQLEIKKSLVVRMKTRKSGLPALEPRRNPDDHTPH